MTTKPDLDLTQPAFTYIHGDITLFGAWFGESLRPCLALLPSYRRRGFKPVVVLMDDAHLWDTQIGSPFYVKQEAPRMAVALGFDPTPATCARIANLINDHLSDLLSIRPKPAELAVVADALLTDESGRQTHHEIQDRV